MQEVHARRYAPLTAGFIEALLALRATSPAGNSPQSSTLASPAAPAAISLTKALTKDEFARRKAELAREHGMDHVPSDIEILTHLTPEQLVLGKEMLRTKPVRADSGVIVVAIMTKPLRCPHGKCTYCPGGPGSHFGDVPQSYTGNEPASLRGLRANWDAYVQVFNRLEQYIVGGHDPQKVELILMGGTFPSYDRAYQDEVIHDVFQAMNDFSAMFYKNDGRASGATHHDVADVAVHQTADDLDFLAFKEFFNLPGSIHDRERTKPLQERIFATKLASPRYTRTIPELQRENETAVIRCIGLTIETRPSHAKREHAQLMLEQGCTRVELGVQTTFDEVLTKVHRDHSVQDTIEAVADLRDLGFKLNFHVMLGLPLMTPERDLEAAHRLFDDPAFRPDMVKLYPCMVMPGTPLYHDYKAGRYTPYDTRTAANVIAQVKRFLPPYVRVMRVQRDIPTKVTTAGVGQTNLRQVVDEECARLGIVCKCIRCREVRGRNVTNVQLNTFSYAASEGTEWFISFDDMDSGALLGFCRLRLPARSLRSEFTPTTAIIRELHVYGTAVGLGEHGNVQHHGLGRKLVAQAERIAREAGKDKMLVISGVGVRTYYEKLGYAHDGPYMGKMLE